MNPLPSLLLPKPFIGSFVAENRHDDLNLWRFYGKENGIEAQGCALTLDVNGFIEATNDLFNDEASKLIGKDDDINFYRVAYRRNDETGGFHIPNASKNEEKLLNDCLIKLKSKIKEYEAEDFSTLEKYLNDVAFLFKSDHYRHENEIRLVIKGIEFNKEFGPSDASEPPRVYIDLINVRNLIKQITIGPKVAQPEEWAAAFHYCFDQEFVEGSQQVRILISRLPYK